MFRTLLLSSLIAAGSVAQDKKPDAKPAEQAPADVKVLTDKEAREVVKDFKNQTKRKAKLAQRMQAVQKLAGMRHKSLVSPLTQVVAKEQAVTVAKIAIEALGNQPAKQARPAILKLMGHQKVKGKPALVSASINSLSRAGYDSRRDWKAVGRLFEREFNEDYVPVQKAILQLVTKTKEKQAIRLLLDHMDEPRPVNVDDPSNPPASYWEARWKAWAKWRADIKEAMYQITGQRFTNSIEARKWIRTNGKKIGIK